MSAIGEPVRLCNDGPRRVIDADHPVEGRVADHLRERSSYLLGIDGPGSF